MDLTSIKQYQADQASQALDSTRHAEVLGHTDLVADAVISAAQALIKYIEGHTAHVMIANPVTSVSTPDVDAVVKGLQVVAQTINEQPQADYTPLVELLNKVVAGVEALPKKMPEVHIPDSVTVSNQIDNTKKLEAIEKAVKAIKLTAEAPVVNVPETKVNVDAPDLKPVTEATKTVQTAVKQETKELTNFSSKSASGLITEAFDEYRVVYKAKFDDDEEDVVGGMKYYLKGKLVATTSYTYDKQGRLTGVKKS